MVTDTKLSSVEIFRKERFQYMKFSEGDAEILATYRDPSYPYAGYAADIHSVEKMLASGCSHETLMRILV